VGYSMRISGTNKSTNNYTLNLTDKQTTYATTTNNYFVIDSVAFYRYNLSNSKIALHYQEGIKELDYAQIVHPDGGYLFSLNHSKIRPVARYYYPGTKTWDKVANENVIVSTNGDYITFMETEASGTKIFTFTETIIIPSSLGVTSSQISWEDDVDNIVVQVSLDNSVWQTCKNNSPIPYFNKNDGMTTGLIYLKVTMSSSNTSTDLPVLRSLSLDFFSNIDFYADNSSDKIYSIKDYGLTRYNHPIISYNDYNGLRMLDGGGIILDSVNPYRTVEMIFTPTSGQNVLYSSNTKIFEWNSAGLITKSGISAIYINGINKTSQTNISNLLTIGEIHHIVIVYTGPISGVLKFNSSALGSTPATYQNIALYPIAFDSTKVSEHYALYTQRSTSVADDSSITMTENSTSVYNNDWLVIQNI
jgi:hypothetical protein